MTILVTGTSGHLGRLIVESLLARGVTASEIRAGARDTAKIADLAAKGVETVHLDYNDPATVAAAIAGAEKVILVSSSEVGKRYPQHQTVIDAAVADGGITQFVYTSAPQATTSILALAPDHKATEEALAASGLPTTILRNNWYTENYLDVVDQARNEGKLVSSTGEGRVASASRKEYAEAAAIVVTEEGHVGKLYELSGDIAWTAADLAVALGEALDREVEYVPISFEEQFELLRSFGLDEGTAGFVVELDKGTRDGALGTATSDLSTLLGRPTTPLAQGLREAIGA